MQIPQSFGEGAWAAEFCKFSNCQIAEMSREKNTFKRERENLFGSTRKEGKKINLFLRIDRIPRVGYFSTKVVVRRAKTNSTISAAARLKTQIRSRRKHLSLLLPFLSPPKLSIEVFSFDQQCLLSSWKEAWSSKRAFQAPSFVRTTVVDETMNSGFACHSLNTKSFAQPSSSSAAAQNFSALVCILSKQRQRLVSLLIPARVARRFSCQQPKVFQTLFWQLRPYTY